MRYLVLWALVAFVVLLGAGLIWLGYVILTTVLSQPGSWWVIGVVFAAVAIATIIASVEYLTDKRPPKKGPPQP